MTRSGFRALPTARDHSEEMSSEAWFDVEKHDVFPEQFPTFLFPPGDQRDTFMELHGELADAAWWRGQQERLRAGIQEDVFAYSERVRFKHRFGGGKRTGGSGRQGGDAGDAGADIEPANWLARTPDGG